MLLVVINVFWWLWQLPLLNRVLKCGLFINLNFDLLIFSSLVRQCTSHQVLLRFICCLCIRLRPNFGHLFLFCLLKLLLLELNLVDTTLQSMSHIKVMIPDELRDYVSDFIYLRHFNQQGYVVIQNFVLHVVVPRQDRKTAFRLQHIASRWVVD